MNPLTRNLAVRRARRHTERIAADFAGTTVETVTGSPYWHADKQAFATVLPDRTRIEVSWASSLPAGLFTTLGVVLPDGAHPDDEASFRTFCPGTCDGVFGLRHAYHKATGTDLPR